MVIRLMEILQGTRLGLQKLQVLNLCTETLHHICRILSVKYTSEARGTLHIFQGDVSAGTLSKDFSLLMAELIIVQSHIIWFLTDSVEKSFFS